MKLHITNCETQQVTILDERQVADLILEMRRRSDLNQRGEAILYIWHGKSEPGPVLEFRDMHGNKGREVL